MGIIFGKKKIQPNSESEISCMYNFYKYIFKIDFINEYTYQMNLEEFNLI